MALCVTRRTRALPARFQVAHQVRDVVWNGLGLAQIPSNFNQFPTLAFVTEIHVIWIKIPLFSDEKPNPA